jgi:hypothetical protein
LTVSFVAHRTTENRTPSALITGASSGLPSALSGRYGAARHWSGLWFRRTHLA